MTKIYFSLSLFIFCSSIHTNELSLDQAQYRYNFAKQNYEKELNKIQIKNKKLQEINLKVDSLKKKLSDMENQKQRAITEIEQSNEEIKLLKKLYKRAEIDLRNILKSD